MKHQLRNSVAQGLCQSGFSPLWEDTSMEKKEQILLG